MARSNGKLLARIDEKVNYHTEQINDFKLDIKEIKKDLAEIKQIFTKGDGKIRRNFMLVQQIRTRLNKRDATIIAVASIIATIITGLFRYLL